MTLPRKIAAVLAGVCVFGLAVVLSFFDRPRPIVGLSRADVREIHEAAYRAVRPELMPDFSWTSIRQLPVRLRARTRIEISGLSLRPDGSVVVRFTGPVVQSGGLVFQKIGGRWVRQPLIDGGTRF